MIRLLVAVCFFALPASAFAQEALYKSYMDAGYKALLTGEWDVVEKMAKLANKEATGFQAEDIRRNFPNNMLAYMHRAKSEYPETIALLKKGLENAEAVGPNNPGIAEQAYSLSNLYLSLNRPDLAEPLMRRALKVAESQPKPENWKLAIGLRSIGICLLDTGKTEEAEVLFKQALKLLESEPTRQSQVGLNLMWLSRLYVAAGRAKEAEALSKQALVKYVENKVSGLMLAKGQFVRADALLATGKPSEAAELYNSGLKLWSADASLADSPELIPVLTAYAKLLRAEKKVAEATKLEARAADLKMKRDKGREALPK